MKIRLPKKYYFKQLQKGKFTKEQVAQIFCTTVQNVDKAYSRFVKPKNPFKPLEGQKKQFIIQNMVTVMVALLSTIMVLVTLFEMQAARNAAYMPCVSLRSAEVAIVWDSNGQTKYLSEEMLEEAKYHIISSDTQVNKIPILKLYNIGAGTAKSIEVEWDIEHNVNEFNKCYESTGKVITYDKQFDFIKVYKNIEDKNNDENWMMIGANSYNYFDFILSSEKDYVSLTLPKIYYEFIVEILSSELYWEKYYLPILTLNIKCVDIQNKVYSKKISLFYRMRAGLRDKNSEGYFVFDLIAREV